MKANEIFDIKKYQSILIEMVEVFDEYCRKNNIRYTLCGGSLLGAVRHKGIIPWDDDLDVIMPRPDYIRFLELSKKSFIENYSIIDYSNKDYYYLPMAKMVDDRTLLIEMEENRKCPIGVNIDIFPIDAIPNDDSKQEELYKKHRSLLKKAYFANRYPFAKSALKSIYYFFRYFTYCYYHIFYNGHMLLKKADELISQENYHKSAKVRIYTSYQHHNKVFDKRVFDEFTDLEFSGLKLMCIKDYDTYLKSLFGDYMKLPPIEKQVCHHRHYLLKM